MSDEFGAKLKLRSDMDSATEHVHMDMYLHIKNIESALDTDGKNADVFGRISRLYRVLGMFMGTQFARELSKTSRVKGTITKTNVLKRNPNYKKIVKLMEFLRQYDEVGYSIKVVEQSPEINEVFQRDIYHNILFNYLVLKGYLEDPEDRQIPTAPRTKKRALKPKFIHQIVEELTEDYDLPDVEIRKVLIEELTKQQLMQEEAAERRRLVEEQAQRKKEEQERIRAEKAAEKERLRQQREAERERIRQEKAAEEARRKQEQMEREIEDRRRSKLLKKEMARFQEELAERLLLRERAEEKQREVQQLEDYEDAAFQLEQAQERKRLAAERLEHRRLEEAERLKRQQLLEKERIRREKAEEAERQKQEEALRLAELARRQQEAEEQAKAQQRAEDMKKLQAYVQELSFFSDGVALHKLERTKLEEERAEQARIREEERRRRREQRGLSSH